MLWYNNPALVLTEDVMEYKCKWCSEIKPEEQFVRRNTKEPYSERNIRCCKACNQARNRQRYKDPEIRRKQIEANGKWRKENPEKMGVYAKEFLERRPNNLKARSKVGHMIRRGYWTSQPLLHWMRSSILPPIIMWKK